MAQIERWQENFRRVGLKKRKLGKLYSWGTLCTYLVLHKGFTRAASNLCTMPRADGQQYLCIRHINLLIQLNTLIQFFSEKRCGLRNQHCPAQTWF